MMGGERFGDENHLEDWFEKIHEEDRSRVAHAFKQARMGISDEIDVEFRMSDKDDRMRWYLCHAASEKDANDDVIRIAGSQTDIHDHKLAAQQLQHDAMHDMLTGLPNRYVFMDRLGQAVHTRSRDREYLYAVMFIDLDRFKNVNDSLGHSAGDELLKGVAKRVSACLRPGDTLARLGGDEFVILVNDFKHVSDVTGLAERINVALAEPVDIHGQELVINASIGIALGSDDYMNPAHLLRDSDIAMYRAKNTGSGKHYIYNESIRQDTMERLKTETELRKAVDNNQLIVYYQPIIELSSGSIYGLEALLRWDHPDRGIIQPDDFIPLAEQTGLIVPIGFWVMETSCEQMKKWKQAYPEHSEMTLSVNLSCKQFLQNNLVESISDILRRTQIDKSDFLLNLEITETVVMQNASCSTDILQDLKALGIRLAVDDFGTGYSSLAYLQRFPIDILKIDKQFVSMIDRDEDSRSIVNTVIELAENLNLRVVAEGIETAEQLEILKETGCHYGQGFFISRPVSGAQLEEILINSPNCNV
jgi:diguanylate cyclase (GGDEF)-like protein